VDVTVTGVNVTVAVIMSSVPVAVGVEVEVDVGVIGSVGVGVLVGEMLGSTVGVSPTGESCARATAGSAARDISISSSKVTRTLTPSELDRFIERFLLLRLVRDKDAT
jgi:hypothetical protein